jgi:hypothetical protein
MPPSSLSLNRSACRHPRFLLFYSACPLSHCLPISSCLHPHFLLSDLPATILTACSSSTACLHCLQSYKSPSLLPVISSTCHYPHFLHSSACLHRHFMSMDTACRFYSFISFVLYLMNHCVQILLLTYSEYLKEHLHEIFHSNWFGPSELLNNHLKYFQFWLRIRRDIRTFVHSAYYQKMEIFIPCIMIRIRKFIPRIIILGKISFRVLSANAKFFLKWNTLSASSQYELNFNPRILTIS